ncbi:uncharacterized protein LOC134650220 [Cydia amplana]|uniref:uncharacterized protein LOC134650220 n=1 Tax=Cydia amplana TaxID=1869771 RepID=UPI002FE657D3
MKITLLITMCMCCYPLETVQQEGPDPWHNKNDAILQQKENIDVTPDLRMSLPQVRTTESASTGMRDWFFKRMLAIILKGGNYKKNEDNSVEVSVQMRFDESQWTTLNDYLNPNVALSEEIFRRSVGYVENAIYKPSVSERIVMAWNDYIQFYLVEYKMEITMAFGILSAAGAMMWLWNHMSHKHFKIIVFIALYLYEVFVSYKEAEQHEFDRYMSAINKCKWYFWSSTCDVPPPDPIKFLKYMNPLKIGVRMFTTIISEPMITISATVQTIIHGITDGMWFPLNVIMTGLLTVAFTVILVVLLVMIVFTYILNIPFNLSFLCGLFSIGVNEKRGRTNISNVSGNQIPSIDGGGDRISSATLDRILDVCTRALTSAQINNTSSTQIPRIQAARPLHVTNGTILTTSLKRSSSTGRLHDYKFCNHDFEPSTTDSGVRKRNDGNTRLINDGSGDAF